MKPVIDLEKEYGLVLEGGGAKGAYQIGAWRALKEAGVKIKGVAGTSVGALNGALICMDDYENAAKYAGDLVNSNRYPLSNTATDFESVWKNDKGTETIWQIAMTSADDAGVPDRKSVV